jgi:hypothetical protein
MPACRSRSTVAIDLVAVIAVQDDLPLEAARELKTVQEHITRVVTTFARIVIPRSIVPVVIAVASVVFRLPVGRRTASQLDPMDLDVARFVIAIPRVIPSRIGAARHRCLLLMDRSLLRRDTPLSNGRSSDYARRVEVRQFAIGWSRLFLGPRRSCRRSLL